MKNTSKNRLLSMVEGALIVALCVVLDLLPLPSWPQGGSITVAMIPLIYYSYRRGAPWGLMAGLVWSAIQMITGWYAPPAGTVWATVLCVLLDYVIAFTALGGAALVAKLFGEKRRLVGYGVGAFAVTMFRFVCSALSGGILWGSYAPEGMNVWVYTITYNASYMIPNAILTTVLVVALAIAADPLTLRPMKRKTQ